MKEIWENKKYRSMIVLGLWLVFITFIFILAMIGNNNRQENEQLESKKEITIQEMVDEFVKDSNIINYKTSIIENNETTILNGTYTLGNFTGYLTNSKEVIQYSCNNNSCYKIFVDHQEPMEDYLFNEVKNPLHIASISPDLVLQNELDNQKIYKYTEINSDGTIEYEVIATLKEINNEKIFQISQININTNNLKIETQISYEKENEN